MNRTRNETGWQLIIRILSVLIAFGFWLLSVWFSKEGFGISLPHLAWAGYVLALGVTVIELIFNRGEKLNPTLYIAGIAAYLYGIGTNIYGILNARSGLIEINVVDWVFAISVGLMIEIIPEPLLMYGLGIDLGDLMTTLLSGNLTPPDVRKTAPDGRTNGRTDTESVVRAYVMRHPTASVREVAAAIGKDKSTVGEIMRKIREEQ